MTDEEFVTTKSIRFQQKHVDKYNASGVGDFSKFVRKAVEAYDVDFETLKQEAKAEAYNDCITKMVIERDFVLQSLQNPLSVVTQTLQTDAQTPSFVRQTLQNTTENTTVVTQNEEDEKPVLQNSLQEEDENDTFVRQMESSPFYEKIKPYLPLLSRQLHTRYKVADDTKKKISDEQGIPKAKVNSFIYEFRNEIEAVDFEIPDKNDRSVEKHYNSVMKKMV